MAESQTDVVNKHLHPQAKTLVTQQVNEFATQLLLRAKIIASEKRADIVLRTHIEEAHNVVLGRGKRLRSRELKLVAGGVFLGAFLQGFIHELSLTTLQPLDIALYTVLGFIGTSLIFWGVTQQ